MLRTKLVSNQRKNGRKLPKDFYLSAEGADLLRTAISYSGHIMYDDVQISSIVDNVEPVDEKTAKVYAKEIQAYIDNGNAADWQIDWLNKAAKFMEKCKGYVHEQEAI